MEKRKLKQFDVIERMQKAKRENTYKWFLDLTDSAEGKIENLSEQGYDNWLMSLFYIAGVDKIDLIMKKESGVEIIQNIIKTAYHEAGHAVCHWLYGGKIGDLGIIIKPGPSTNGTCGLCSFDQTIKASEEATREMQATIMEYHDMDVDYTSYVHGCLAGFAAADSFMISLGLQPEKLDLSQSDHWNAEYFLKKCYPDDSKSILALRLYHHYKKVRDSFFHPSSSAWDAVVKTAEQLLIKSHLSNNEFEEIMKQSSAMRFRK